LTTPQSDQPSGDHLEDVALTRVGFIGLGNMGQALALRLGAAYPLSVFDERENRVAELVATGADGMGSVSEVAAGCDVLCTCLPTPSDVEDVLFGAGGGAVAIRKGGYIIDFSSSSPIVSVELAARLSELGVAFVDAPVSGGPQAAAAGTIAIMVGADESSFEAIKQLLTTISPNVSRVGAVGAGHCVKLLNNVLAAGNRLLAFEMAALATAHGVAPEVFIDVVNKSSGRSYASEVTFGRHVFSDELTQHFSLGLMTKDVSLATGLTPAGAVSMSIARSVQQLLQAAVEEVGASADINELIRLYERAMGVTVAHERSAETD
jgi:3-hydroxyisobutyrate dehydrogenase